MKKEKILSGIEENKDELLKFASKLIEFKTPNPPGKNTLKAQKWLASELEKLGMKVDIFDVYPDEPDVIGTLRGKEGKKTLVFSCHMDVAQVKEDEKWDFDPFKAKYDEKYLYGRGSTDMKGGLACVYFAIKTLVDAGINLKQNVMFQSVIGEEAGEPGTRKALEKGYKGNFALTPEPNNLKIQGQGGAVTLWIKIKSPKVYHDGIRYKMIHAGGGIDGGHAIEKMYKILRSMQELERYWAVMKKYPGIPPGANTINPAVIEGGRHPAFIADECKLWYTIHFLPNENVDDIQREITDHITKTVNSDIWLRKNPPQLVWGGESLVREKGEVFPSAEVDKNNPNVKLLSKTYEEVFGKKPEISVWPSVSDAGWFSKFKIPAVICGPGSLEDAHAVNEKIAIKEMLDATKLYANFILNFCQLV